MKNAETSVITHYDLLIEENNDPFRDPPGLQAYMDRWDGPVFLDSLRLDRSKAVLEIGVGTGRLAGRVAPRCGWITGIDVSPKTVERAGKNLKAYANVTLVCGDFLTHVFENTFDVIYSSLTMMHFADKRRVIQKVEALLNPGGVFCVSLDKNQSETIDMGTRKVKIYPDDPEKMISLMESAAMRVTARHETEAAYLIVCGKEAQHGETLSN